MENGRLFFCGKNSVLRADKRIKKLASARKFPAEAFCMLIVFDLTLFKDQYATSQKTIRYSKEYMFLINNVSGASF